jgi:hypothetical protein
MAPPPPLSKHWMSILCAPVPAVAVCGVASVQDEDPVGARLNHSGPAPDPVQSLAV